MARRASNPVVVLVCLSITVSMALLVLWQWADAQTLVPAEPTIAAAADPTVALTTPVLSVRRAPTVLSRETNVAQFEVDLQPLLDQVGTTSCVSVAVDGRAVAGRNQAVPVLPASTMKLLVAAAALEVLGPSYTFRTSVYGTVEGGVVAGDLVLLGGGDPVLTSEAWAANTYQKHPPIEITRLEDLADALVAAGITRVEGRVVGDGSRYDDEWFNPTWSRDIKVTEAGPIDGLVVDDARVGGSAASDPALGAAQVFTKLLRDRSITVGQGAATGTGDATNEIAGIDSAPLSAILHEMLETSDDNTAEMLVKELGVANGAGGTTAAGLTVVTDVLGRWGVPLDGVLLVDGSGLSRDDRVTCDTLLGALEHGSVDDAVGQGLPVAAVSGTLDVEFVGTSMAGILRAKTGSLTGVKALAGYVPAAGGSVIEFALVLDQPGANDPSVYRSVWEGALADAFATYPSGASADDLAPRLTYSRPMAVLPMFPLGSVLLPGAVLPLHVFEPRYRVLVADCIESDDHEFGVSLIERGSEVGGGDQRTMVGTVARMLQVAELDDGRYAVVCVGTRRVRVNAWLPDDPYPLADVDDWPDDEAQLYQLTDRIAATTARVRRACALANELGDSAADPSAEVGDDPVLATYQLVALAPLGAADAQALLSAPGPLARLDLLDALLDDIEMVLRFRLDEPGGGLTIDEM